MIEVFTTNIQDADRAGLVLQLLEQNFPALRFNFDFSDWKPSGCPDTVLRVEGPTIDRTRIISAVESSGFRCDVLPDKVCK